MTGHVDGPDADTPDDETIRFELPLGIAFQAFLDAQTHAFSLARAVGAAIQDHHAPPQEGEPHTRVKFVLAGIERGSVRVLLKPDKPDAVPGLSHALVEGMAAIAERASRPTYFSDDALEAASKLARIASRMPGALLRNGTAVAPLTVKVAEHAAEVLERDTTTEYGTVEGRLDSLNVHQEKQRYFVVYDALNDTRIECRFAYRIPLAEVTAAVERRVAVHGQIRYKSNGGIQYVTADALETFPAESDLPDVDDIRRILGSQR